MTIRKKLITSALVLLLIAMVGAGTLAYFTAEDTATNVITSGSIDIELQETTEDGSVFEDVVNVVPGQEISKIVKIHNQGLNDAYVRISLEQFIEMADGKIVTDVSNLIHLDINKDKWTEVDGYYYYNEPLAPGATTEALFEVVTFDPGMGNEYLNSEATIEVYAQATQVKNNGATVFEAAGWPAKATEAE